MERRKYRTKSVIEKKLPIRELNKLKKLKEEEDLKNNKNKFNYIGELTLGKDEDTFKKLNPSETPIVYSEAVLEENKYISIIDNGPKYSRDLNPYEKMVNLSMVDMKQNINKFSFKAKAFYEKAVELSQLPSMAKMNKNNPIYQHIYNPKDNCYYNIEGI